MPSTMKASESVALAPVVFQQLVAIRAKADIAQTSRSVEYDQKLKFCCPHIGQSTQFVAALEPLLKIEALSCEPAGIIPWRARPANIRPHGVDRASRTNTNVSQQSCTTITAASHAPSVLIHVHVRDSIELSVAFQ